MIKHIPILPPRYRFSGLANSGGYGTAYHCEDVNLKRDVIVKTISKPTDFHKLINEIHSLQRTKSNHVVQIYDVIRDSDGDPCAIVEEYLPGDDLTNFKIDAVTAHEFLMILYQIITGIHDMHAFICIEKVI
jgi:serine/threonine-protein kinase